MAATDVRLRYDKAYLARVRRRLILLRLPAPGGGACRIRLNEVVHCCISAQSVCEDVLVHAKYKTETSYNL